MPILSDRIEDLHPSPIREILSVIEHPGMVSFAGGLPSAETFPEFNPALVPKKYLQYGPSEGEPELRKAICNQVQESGLPCQPEQILILSGSQQGIDLVAKMMVDSGTGLALEYPSYLAALQVFRFFGAEFMPIDKAHSERLLEMKKNPSLAYVVPTFQNPTGYCYTNKERTELASTCDEGDIVLFEDDPYRELVYEPCDRTPICSLLKKASWIYQGSFSKTLAPGLRLGYLVCSNDLIMPLTYLKQASDLHSNRLSQWLVLNELNNHEHIQNKKKLISYYQKKKSTFNALLIKYLSSYASWEAPKGGLFFWLRLKRQCDTKALFQKAIKANIAFMPGEDFFAHAIAKGSFIRLNFSHSTAKEAEKGIRVLADLLKPSKP